MRAIFSSFGQRKHLCIGSTLILVESCSLKFSSYDLKFENEFSNELCLCFRMLTEFSEALKNVSLFTHIILVQHE